jgi:tRNA (guanine37-N1)-methyltransferase
MSCCCAADTKGWTSGVRELVATEELSIGDYVLSGGELPALVIIDAVSRLIPGVVGDEQSVEQDSFSRRRCSTTRTTRGRRSSAGLKVPDVLLSGITPMCGDGGERPRWRARWNAGPSVDDAPIDEDRRCWTR